jgi:hypothetical protein
MPLSEQEKFFRREYRKLVKQAIRSGKISIPPDLTIRQMLSCKFKKVNYKDFLCPIPDLSWTPATLKVAPFTCKFCGAPSWVDPADQAPPPDYCHESSHGEPGNE